MTPLEALRALVEALQADRESWNTNKLMQHAVQVAIEVLARPEAPTCNDCCGCGHPLGYADG